MTGTETFQVNSLWVSGSEQVTCQGSIFFYRETCNCSWVENVKVKHFQNWKFEKLRKCDNGKMGKNTPSPKSSLPEKKPSNFSTVSTKSDPFSDPKRAPKKGARIRWNTGDINKKKWKPPLKKIKVLVSTKEPSHFTDSRRCSGTCHSFTRPGGGEFGSCHRMSFLTNGHRRHFFLRTTHFFNPKINHCFAPWTEDSTKMFSLVPLFEEKFRNEKKSWC